MTQQQFPRKATGPKLVAVVYNPVKVKDEQGFRRHVASLAADSGWQEPLLLPTTPDDPGQGMVTRALDAGASLVIAAGGDGTVRVVAAGLVGTDIPLGLVPRGTGNLLARNLGIPLDQAQALRVAFTGQPTKLDAIQMVIDGAEPDFFFAFAGIGFDAEMMNATNERLKKAVGNTAYVVSFAQSLHLPARRISYRLDDGHWRRRRAVLIMFGNVAQLQGGLELMQGADPHDGLVDLLLAAPRGLTGWLQLAVRTLLRQPAGPLNLRAGRISVHVDEPIAYEFDGDTLGEATSFEATALPGALTLHTPAR